MNRLGDEEKRLAKRVFLVALPLTYGRREAWEMTTVEREGDFSHWVEVKFVFC